MPTGNTGKVIKVKVKKENTEPSKVKVNTKVAVQTISNPVDVYDGGEF